MPVNTCVERLPRTCGTLTPPATATYARAPRRRSPNFNTEPAVASIARFISTGTSSSVRSKFCACHRERRSCLEPHVGTHQRYFERRHVPVITQQVVRQAMRVPVQRAAYRHTARLEAPSTQVLHGREHARTQNGQHSHVTRLQTSRSRQPSRETVALSSHRTASPMSCR